MAPPGRFTLSRRSLKVSELRFPSSAGGSDPASPTAARAAEGPDAGAHPSIRTQQNPPDSSCKGPPTPPSWKSDGTSSRRPEDPRRRPPHPPINTSKDVILEGGGPGWAGPSRHHPDQSSSDCFSSQGHFSTFPLPIWTETFFLAPAGRCPGSWATRPVNVCTYMCHMTLVCQETPPPPEPLGFAAERCPSVLPQLSRVMRHPDPEPAAASAPVPAGENRLHPVTRQKHGEYFSAVEPQTRGSLVSPRC